MPRKPIARSNEHYYHITARSNNQEFFYLSTDEVWKIMIAELLKLQKDLEIKIAAFVLMNNHYHLLMLTPKSDIDRVMYFFMKEVTLKIQKRTDRINKIFGGRYKGSLIENYGHLFNVYKYIYRNPLVVQLCERAEDYPYSSLYYQHRPLLKFPITLDPLPDLDDCGFFIDRDELRWINHAFLGKEAESIRCGLQKSTFSYARDKATNRAIIPN